MISFFYRRWYEYNFLFEELVKRDFNKKYKKTFLGIAWSMLAPLFQLLVMSIIFMHFFGSDIPHFVIYVFIGLTLYGFFKESTSQGMQSLVANSSIISKVKVPKYIFLLSKNVASLLNFGLMLIILFFFAAIDGVQFQWQFIFLLYPIVTLVIFNVGVGLVLSALFVFFKDVQYLYDILTLLIMWMSAIFYSIETFSPMVQRLFLLNPVFAHIHYFRLVILHATIPAWHIHLACGLAAALSLVFGAYFYKRYNFRFIYYM